jgi:hypothetical protein
VILLTSICRQLSYFIDWGAWWLRNMENRLDVLTIVIAICVAGYVALAIDYLARLGFTLQEIRGAAVLIAVAMATLVGIDFFGKKLRKAK